MRGVPTAPSPQHVRLTEMACEIWIPPGHTREDMLRTSSDSDKHLAILSEKKSIFLIIVKHLKNQIFFAQLSVRITCQYA